ncbi:hypothetical protein [Pseudomonas syringae]|uniref:hypothetical protein n=1 Tax=Pseudomonas syringae TaxID=317 RepID=UPI000306F1EC|nr:hypothetical protein [Pseudomonas syringae]KOG03491.1 ABC-type nitrate/sulfonate/bicarbonate transport system, periplasmic component Precursor [Pseudomonas syringae pv. aceris]
MKQAVRREIDVQGYPNHALVSKPSWDSAMKVALFAKNIQAYPSPATGYEAVVDVSFAKRLKH